ncbi:MAG: redox-active disulfide protein 2 [Candidatus Cloacimonetes bacterium 4572_65]|nr:MAG: redox-active disulfide protein 2 [Candidatus Cloacimonetes bacterium 4572_65]
MNIKILGSGCAKCNTLEKIVKKAISQLEIDATVEHITDMVTIIKYGVMMTPALVINEKLISSGKSYSSKAMKKLLESLI